MKPGPKTDDTHYTDPCPFTLANLQFLANVTTSYRAMHNLTPDDLARRCNVGAHIIFIIEGVINRHHWTYWWGAPLRSVINVVLAKSPPCHKSKVEPDLKLTHWWSPECAKPKVPIGSPYNWPGRRRGFAYADVAYDVCRPQPGDLT